MESIYQKHESNVSNDNENSVQPVNLLQKSSPALEDQTENATVSVTKTKKETDASKKKPKVILNNSDCRYEVVRYVSKKLLGYKLTADPEIEWDVFWTDNAVQPETLARMQPYQKINHFPGMYSLARKNHLGRNLMRMKRTFPDNYDFFPQTYLLPAEYSEFRAQFNGKNKGKTFIVKPEASCQGKGIFLTRTYENVQPGEHYVVQRYLHKPFLLDGLKFDLRIYVLLAGTDPLRIYIYDDGLGRFATEDYIAPSAQNLENMCMHLTNYAINKDNPNFVFNKSAQDDDVGHKRSLKAVMKMLEERGHDVKALWNDIKKILIKTFCSVQPILAHNYKSCQPDEPSNNMCFELLGIDIMLDHKLRPWLLEVNHTPSFTTDTPLDKAIKRSVIRDTLTLMNVSATHRVKYKNKKKIELQQRVLTGKKTKATPEEKQAAFEKAQQERDKWENSHLGGFEKVYPFDDPSKAEENYDEFIRVAHKWWEEWTGTATKKNIKKETAGDGKRLPPMSFGQSSPAPNQVVRAKEIQNVYTQRTKLGSGNQKVKKDSEVFDSVKNNPSDDGPANFQDENAAAVQPWNSGNSELNPLPPEKIVGEDDQFYYGSIVPIKEQNSGADSDINDEEDDNVDGQVGSETLRKNPSASTLPQINMSNVKHSEKISSFDVGVRGTNTSRGLGAENTYDTCIQSEQAKNNGFKTRKPVGSTLMADPLNKATAVKIGKENYRVPAFQKTANSLTAMEQPNILSTTADSDLFSKSLNRISENLQMRQDKADVVRVPLKLATGPLGESIGFDDVTRLMVDNDSNSKSLNRLDAGGRLNSIRSDPSLKAYQKKNTIIPSLQQKSNNGNFVTPRVFELSFQGMKTDQPKRNTTGGMLYSGIRTSGRSLTKTPLNQKEVSYPSSMTVQNQEAQSNLNKYFNYQYEVKK